MNLGILYCHSPGASQGMRRAHGRGPELTVSRQEGKLFPADVLRYFLPKTKKNGLGLLEDGLDMPRDGVDTLVGVRSSDGMSVMGPHRAPVHCSVGRRREAARASSHLFRGFWRDLVRSVPSSACVQF